MIYLGKILVRWCKHCDVPVLDDTCGRCGGDTEKVMLTPPGDVRPGFVFDRQLIRKVIERQFGRAIVPEVLLLNDVPAIDRMDEVIFNGRVAGALRYDIETKIFRFLPRLWYASKIAPTRGYVVADVGAVPFILKSENLMAPGVIEVSPEIQSNDEVIIFSPERKVIATGRAFMSAEEMLSAQYGMAVKVRHKGSAVSSQLSTVTWADVLDANRTTIDSYVLKAIQFIRKAKETYHLPITVSFSGGKDSLATLLLVTEAGYRPPLIFVDTGLEFPETLKHVHEVAAALNLPLFEEQAGDAFWQAIELFGPPARDFRWCCKTCKLGPMSRLIKQYFPGGVLSFIGQRRYESEQRSKKGSVWRNPWVAEQIGASPIQHWTALHVWLYLFYKHREVGIKWNPLYEQGFSRIGCWLCPACDLAEFEFKKHEDWPVLTAKLQSFAERHGLPEEWQQKGLWRWRHSPNWAKSNYVIKQDRSYPLAGKTDRIADFLRVIGPTEKIDDSIIDINGTRVQLNKESINDWAIEVRDVVFRALHCTGCGVCIGKCQHDAIIISNGQAWIQDNCTHCKKCMDECVVLVFG